MKQVTQVWRAALDACQVNSETYKPQANWLAELSKISEGTQATLGAYHRPWQ